MDAELLRQAWVHAQHRYSSLRLRFDWEEELVQVIDHKGLVDWRYQDLGMLGTEEQEAVLSAQQSSDRLERYELSESGLFRIYLVRRSDSHYSCLFSSHHAILDGWSTPLLFAYVHEVYLQLLKGVDVQVEEDVVYGSSQAYLQSHRLLSESYWRSYLGSGTLSHPELSSLMHAGQGHTDPSCYGHILSPERYEVRIEGSRYQEMKALGIAHGFTVNALLQYLWHKQLSIYGHSEQTVVGMVVSGRNLPVPGIEFGVGLYINTLPVVHHHGSGSILCEIQRLQGDINEINSHSEMRLAGLGASGSSRLFSSLFVYENYPVNYDAGKFEDFSISLRGGVEKMDYPLCVTAYEQQGLGVVRLDYAGELFAGGQMEALLDGMLFYLDQLLAVPDLGVSGLDYLDRVSCVPRVEHWNSAIFGDISADTDTLPALFERQVRERGDAVAVVFEGERLTYAELNKRANQLGHYLQERYDLQGDELVVLCFERSLEMLIGILGVLKAGGAYVPVDPGYPSDRLRYILNDTGCRVVLSSSVCVDLLEGLSAAAVVALDGTDFVGAVQDYPLWDVRSSSVPSNLAYVIYTSGTTGQPKGVMVEQCSYVHLLAYYRHTYFDEGTPINTFSITSYVFDIWGLEYGLPLISGGCVELSSSDFHDLDTSVYDFIQFTPSLLSAKLDELRFNDSGLKIFVGGEALSGDLAVRVFSKSASVELVNVYGPTETTIWSLNRLNVKDDFNTSIGHPIANTTAYVLDDHLHLLPLGVIGELYIGGIGVSRGYLNLPELTAERFILNPFQSAEERLLNRNGRLYRTGDLVRYLSDGSLEYLGRNDFQVKIRGYRIELGEIEQRLSLYPGISQSVVMALDQDMGNKYLAGYYVSDVAVERNLLVSFLRESLPDYMVPSVFVQLEHLPLTINGKLDRKGLPVPGFSGGKDYHGPETELQESLCLIWSEVLGIPATEIGIHDDFFGLGGNSITAIKLISRINHQLNTDLRIAELFMRRSIENLSVFLENKVERKIIISLNKAIDKPDLFMIHPGNGGCEVYTSLAKGLTDQYQCHGVDSYNLYHSVKIDNLNQLAAYYLEQIDQVKREGDQNFDEYILLGWSLGGQIALEMAVILESRGVKNIRIHLLDTILHDGEPQHELTEEIINKLIDDNGQSYPDIIDFEDRARSLLLTEHKLIGQAVSSKLIHSKILLFKAAEPVADNKLYDPSEIKFINGLDNHLNKVLNTTTQLEIINMEYVQHENILDDEACLLSGIKQFKSNGNKL